MQVKTFQGGGLYDSRGQVIHIAEMADGRVAMIDSSRGLTYIFDKPKYPTTLKTYIIGKYLHNEGHQPSSREDYTFTAAMIDAVRNGENNDV